MARPWRHGEKNKAKRYGEHWRWLSSEPKEWRKLQKHKKRRQAARACRHKCLRGETETLWPLDKKPWIYYW